MVSLLDRKLLRDLYRLRGQALTIALVVGVGVGSYITLRTAWRALGQSRAAYYDHYRFADVFASLKRAPESVAERVGEVPGVSKVCSLRPGVRSFRSPRTACRPSTTFCSRREGSPNLGGAGRSWSMNPSRRPTASRRVLRCPPS